MSQKLFPILIICLFLGQLIAKPAAVAAAPTQAIAVQPEKYYLEAVPFVPQAPFGEWKDKRFQDGCEETASLIAVLWAKGKTLNKAQAKQEIIKMAAYEQKKYGGYVDTSAEDTLARLIKGYFKYDKAAVKKNITADDIITEIKNGNLVIAPFNGRLLRNPYYTQPGPERHMIVIRGYDEEKKEFITNDIGTRRGEDYRYPKDVLFSAIRDYPSGNHKPIKKVEKNIIVIKNN